jgi:hypothetical protein
VYLYCSPKCTYKRFVCLFICKFVHNLLLISNLYRILAFFYPALNHYRFSAAVISLEGTRYSGIKIRTGSLHCRFVLPFTEKKMKNAVKCKYRTAVGRCSLNCDMSRSKDADVHKHYHKHHHCNLYYMNITPQCTG